MTFEPDHGAASTPAPSLWRRSWDRLKTWRPAWGRGAASAPSGRRRLWSWIWRIVVVVLVLYFPVGALIVHSIDDDPQFAPRNVAPGESRAVAAAAQLVTREVDVNTWTPMMPFFTPAGILDNMPNFQRGIMAALGRFSTELMDQVGRVRGTSQVDRDLEQARGFLNEQPNIWIWQPSVSLWPSATSAQKYRAGRDKLVAYNKRLASGQAVFERRADNLQALIDRIANDEGSDSAVIDQHIIESAGDLFDIRADGDGGRLSAMATSLSTSCGLVGCKDAGCATTARCLLHRVLPARWRSFACGKSFRLLDAYLRRDRRETRVQRCEAVQIVVSTCGPGPRRAAKGKHPLTEFCAD